jgi:hypothetical protein
LTALFAVPSLAQVLLDPIASRPVGTLFAIVSVLPLAWRCVLEDRGNLDPVSGAQHPLCSLATV